MLAPISWRTPPRHYGPWELVTSLLTEALVARAVDVTLFATQDSITSGKLAAVCPAPYSEDSTIDAKVWETLHVANVFEKASEFDLIHNQADFVALAFSRLVRTPIVTTIHGFSSERILPAYKAYEDRVHYVAISNATAAAILDADLKDFTRMFVAGETTTAGLFSCVISINHWFGFGGIPTKIPTSEQILGDCASAAGVHTVMPAASRFSGR
jgi:hypothetical protein